MEMGKTIGQSIRSERFGIWGVIFPALREKYISEKTHPKRTTEILKNYKIE